MYSSNKIKVKLINYHKNIQIITVSDKATRYHRHYSTFTWMS